MNKVPKLNVAQDSDTTVSCHKERAQKCTPVKTLQLPPPQQSLKFMTLPYPTQILSDLKLCFDLILTFGWKLKIRVGNPIYDQILTMKKSETNARPSREKKMRKKRKTKKKVQDEGVSETDSSEDGMNQNVKPSPQKRKSLSKEEKPVPSSIQA